MPESTLSLTNDELRAEIGAFLGYGRGAVYSETAWTTPQINNITRAFKKGLSQVYTPPQVGRDAPHEWTWLKPIRQITLDSGKSEAMLPSYFGGFEGLVWVTSPTSSGARGVAIQVTHDGILQQKHSSQPETTGFPKFVCEKMKPGVTPDGSTRSVLWVWPVADQAYTFAVKYKYMPDALTGTFKYPPGGAEHSELFMASMLAAAEVQLDDVKGVRHQDFMERLIASIAVDNKRKGTFLGYNGDPSQHGYQGVDRRLWDNPAVTYNGNPL